jgi:hypothetical protein
VGEYCNSKVSLELIAHAEADLGREHLCELHLISFRCDSCDIKFSDQNDLETHYKNQPQGHRVEGLSRDGINPVQWQKINNIDIRGTVTNETQAAEDKWFQIWDTLFPHIVAPKDPCIFSRPILSFFSLTSIQGITPR